MDYNSLLFACLKEKEYLTNLEKELLAVIIAVYSSTQGTVDIRDNLEKQLMVLLVKEGCQLSQQAETDVEGITGKQ